MARIRTKHATELDLAAIRAGKVLSNQQIRILLVEILLQYLENEIPLSLILSTGAALHQQYHAQLDPDLLQATATLADLAEHTTPRKSYSFLEHQKIEDTLATIQQQLTKSPASINSHT